MRPYTPTIHYSPEIADRARRVAADQAADLETINEWRGIYRHADEGILRQVIDALGYEGAFRPEALKMIADEYRAMERRHERTREHNRRIQEAAHG